MASPQTIQPATSDTTLAKGNPDTNYNTNNTFQVGRNFTDWFRGIMTFNFSAIVPAGATITMATFSLGLYSHNASAEEKVINVYRLLHSDYSVTQATWNVYKTSNNWTTAGANSDGNDYTSTYAASYTMPNPITNSVFIDFDVKNQVQYCLDNSSGIWTALIVGGEAVDRSDVTFVSSNWSAQSALYPKLYLAWTVPSGPANLKSYNTNLKANIKSINTNLIANVKTLDTNA